MMEYERIYELNPSLKSPIMDAAGLDEHRPHSNTPPLEIFASSSPSDVEDVGPFLMTSRPTWSLPFTFPCGHQKLNKTRVNKTRVVFHASFFRGYVKLLNAPLSGKSSNLYFSWNGVVFEF